MPRALAFVLLFPLILSLSACGGGGASPSHLMAEFCRIYTALPVGQVYQSGTAEWEAGYLSPALSDALFSEDNGENALSLCHEYAIFLASSFEGGEIAFLRCGSQEDAARVGEACLDRIKRVRQARPQAEIVKDACVLRYGRTVVLLLLSDNVAAKKVIDGLL